VTHTPKKGTWMPLSDLAWIDGLRASGGYGAPLRVWVPRLHSAWIDGLWALEGVRGATSSEPLRPYGASIPGWPP
jgi:hypothetical protein